MLGMEIEYTLNNNENKYNTINFYIYTFQTSKNTNKNFAMVK